LDNGNCNLSISVGNFDFCEGILFDCGAGIGAVFVLCFVDSTARKGEK
jgi:hypothetical protein